MNVGVELGNFYYTTYISTRTFNDLSLHNIPYIEFEFNPQILFDTCSKLARDRWIRQVSWLLFCD